MGFGGGGRHPAADYDGRQLPYLTIKIVVGLQLLLVDVRGGDAAVTEL